MPCPHRPQPGQTVVNDECAFEGVRDPSIYAIGSWVEKEVGGALEAITFAARPDLERLAFESLPVSLVTRGHDKNRD